MRAEARQKACAERAQFDGRPDRRKRYNGRPQLTPMQKVAGIATRCAQARRLIAEIESTNVGAFSPLSQDPLLLSLSLPFGGASGLLFLEQLMGWM